MGAVKTNRNAEVDFESFGPKMMQYAELKKMDRSCKRSCWRLFVEVNDINSLNNRRKMSGLPLIRRAKS